MIKTILYHILYWIFALSLCILIIGYKGDWHEAIFLTLVFSPIPIGSAYLITYYLLEEFLLKQRYIRFFVFMVYILIASLYTATLINSAIFIFVADYKFYRMPPATRIFADPNFYFIFIGYSLCGNSKHQKMEPDNPGKGKST